MQVVFVEHKNNLSIKSINTPDIKDDEVLIKVKVAGICGSDIHTYNDVHSFRKPPASMGHELSGVVVKNGKNVNEKIVGQKVTVMPQRGCGICIHCKYGEINLCNNRVAPGVNDWLGSMADYFVAHSSIVFPIPEYMSYKTSALAEPLSVGFRTVEKADVKTSDNIAILGSGTIGLLSLHALISKGVNNTIITDIREYPLNIAEKIGASYVFNTSKYDNWTEKILNITQEKVDKVIIANDAPNIINEALKIVKKGGKIITVAMFNQKQHIDISNLQSSEKEIIGCMTYNKSNFYDALNLLEKDSRNNEEITNSIITHSFPLREAHKGFEIMNNKKENVLKVILRL